MPLAAFHRNPGAPRRRLLKGVAGVVIAAALPLPRSRAATLPRVAVIGGGMAGVACAWLLDGVCDVRLFEARGSLGGNVRTVPLSLGGQTRAVDLGAQYFHPGPYPTYVQLLETWACGRWPRGSAAFRVDHAGRAQREPAALRFSGAAGPHLAAVRRLEPTGGAGIQGHLRRRAPARTGRRLVAAAHGRLARDAADHAGTGRHADPSLGCGAELRRCDADRRVVGAGADGVLVSRRGPPRRRGPDPHHRLPQARHDRAGRSWSCSSPPQVATGTPVDAVTPQRQRWLSMVLPHQDRHSSSTPWCSPPPARRRSRCCKACPARPWHATPCRASASTRRNSRCIQTPRSHRPSAAGGPSSIAVPRARIARRRCGWIRCSASTTACGRAGSRTALRRSRC